MQVIEEIELLVIGGGPAGLTSALHAGRYGTETAIVDDAIRPGGQLIKQTHKFFGSKMEYAGTRGFQIAELLLKELSKFNNVKIYDRTTATGYYEDGVITCLRGEKYFKIKPKRVIIATGAFERMIPFVGNDLPGVYGAGAVQTVMNLYGVVPAKRALMVGAGNIGLIISYQLLQAGVEVVAIIEGMDKIGGYQVHSSKVRRMGVPILTRHTIIEAVGEREVEGAIISKIDENWRPIPGTEKRLDVDTICLAVGLSPTIDILRQAGAKIVYIPELGGDVAIRDEFMETTAKGIYVAGDTAGIEEASSAIIEGAIAGISAAKSLGKSIPDFEKQIAKLREELNNLRAGPFGEKIKQGLEKLSRFSI
ncbi:pyridine nucleotide-disulfide oxidoreductase [bacterium]|nr:MAG: pyridine nucleotide-disulfide oxidoreductase [bacterium]